MHAPAASDIHRAVAAPWYKPVRMRSTVIVCWGHVYSQYENARKVFYLFLQLVHTLFQLMQNSSLLNAFPNGLRTAKNLAFCLLEAWRNLSINTSDLLLLGCGSFQIRFNSP